MHLFSFRSLKMQLRPRMQQMVENWIKMLLLWNMLLIEEGMMVEEGISEGEMEEEEEEILIEGEMTEAVVVMMIGEILIVGKSFYDLIHVCQ